MADDTEVKKQMDELVELNKQLLARVEKTEADNRELTKLLDEATVQKADGDACKMDDGSAGTWMGGKCVAEGVEKAEVPEAIQKKLDAQAEEIKKSREEISKMREKEETREWIAKAASYADLPIKAEELGPILKSATATLSPEMTKELDRVLKAGSEACKALTKASGSGNTGGGSTAYDKLSGLAKEEMKKAGNVTFEKAFVKVSDANPDLVAQHRQEQRSSH